LIKPQSMNKHREAKKGFGTRGPIVLLVSGTDKAQSRRHIVAAASRGLQQVSE